jgi:hypothetical protein
LREVVENSCGQITLAKIVTSTSTRSDGVGRAYKLQRSYATICLSKDTFIKMTVKIGPAKILRDHNDKVCVLKNNFCTLYFRH